MADFLYIDYLRAMLYLFSIYNIISSSIASMRDNKRLFCVHMAISFVLFMNFLGIIFIRILGIEWLDTVIFEYSVTIVLVVLNVLVWIRLYYQSGIEKRSSIVSPELETILSSASGYDNKNLSEIAANANLV